MSSIKFIFGKINERAKLNRDREINKFKQEFEKLKIEISKVQDPFDIVIKSQAILALTIRNKIKLYNRFINYCQKILNRTEMVKDIINEKININNEFLENFKTILLLNKHIQDEELKDFVKKFISQKKIICDSIKIFDKINEEINLIINFKNPSPFEIEEIICENLKALGKNPDNYIQRNKEIKPIKDDIYIPNIPNINDNENKINNQENLVEHVNYNIEGLNLHISKIINKMKEVGI